MKSSSKRKFQRTPRRFPLLVPTAISAKTSNIKQPNKCRLCSCDGDLSSNGICKTRAAPHSKTPTPRVSPSGLLSLCATKVQRNRRPTQFLEHGTATRSGTSFLIKPQSVRRCSATKPAKLSRSTPIRAPANLKSFRLKRRLSINRRPIKRSPKSRRLPSDLGSGLASPAAFGDFAERMTRQSSAHAHKICSKIFSHHRFAGFCVNMKLTDAHIAAEPTPMSALATAMRPPFSPEVQLVSHSEIAKQIAAFTNQISEVIVGKTEPVKLAVACLLA